MGERVQALLQREIMADEGALLTGWCLSFEMVDDQGKPFSGFFIGPTTTPWKALGLMAWAEKLLEQRHIQEG